MIRFEHTGMSGWRCRTCWVEVAMMVSVVALASLAVVRLLR